MNKALGTVLIVVLLLAGLVPAAGCSRKVTVTTGEMVICTAGEVIEDNTEQIEVPEGDVADYSVTTKVVTCEQHSDLATIYADAQKAIAEGDLVVARERLRTIVDRDPTYRSAADQLATIDSGASPDPDTDAETPAETPDPANPDGTTDEPIGPVANLAQYVPDAIAGYSAQGIIADVGSLSRQYLPTSGTADQLVIAVDQMVDAEAAASAASAMVADYPQNTSTKTVGGATVTVGVRDGFVAAAFSDGAVLVVVELHAKSGSASGLVDAVLAVAEAIVP